MKTYNNQPQPDFFFIANGYREAEKITANDDFYLEAWNTEISAETERKVIGFESSITYEI